MARPVGVWVLLQDELSAEPPLTLAAAAAQGGDRGGQLAGDLAEGVLLISEVGLPK